MSTNLLRTTAQSTLRHSLCYRPPAYSRLTPLRQFHATLPKMTVHVLDTPAAFEQAVKDHKVVLLDCFATWCGPCKAIAPVLAKYSDQFPSIYFAKIDVDELPELAQQLKITAMPTFLLFTGSTEPADILIGAKPNAILELIEKYKGLAAGEAHAGEQAT
ncbi:thioredoxin-like protein [Durotheca rogersii]|uniref:thioredoxin-like protein n=1 Tax=Durotheca rogersii TaxID=419775 RepID=UPI00221EBBDE|nr:thioredoxin-like protein [Durotheca rogersii]KAI5866734.1 thioredoxin-like protein [Durotheca rogersii]